MSVFDKIAKESKNISRIVKRNPKKTAAGAGGSLATEGAAQMAQS